MVIPKNPEDININASQQGLLEIAEHFFRQKMRQQEQEEKDGGANPDTEK